MTRERVLKSTICVIVKNEGPYLLEWIAHHSALGFDNIMIYDNNSTDGSDVILQRLDRAGVISYRHWPLGKAESPQITAYKNALPRMITDWVLFLDADEFLVLHKHKTVNEFLATFDNRPEVTTIGVNWRIFGDSHLATYDGRLIRERLEWASEKDFGPNIHIKSFSRLNALGSLVNMHMCETTGQKVLPSGEPFEVPSWGLSSKVEFEVAQVNHYYAKTYEEYQTKKARGSSDMTEGDERKYLQYHDEAFHGHNRNDVIDNSIRDTDDVFYPELKRLQWVTKKNRNALELKLFQMTYPRKAEAMPV